MSDTPSLSSAYIVLDLLYMQTRKFEEHHLGHKMVPPQFEELVKSYALIEGEFSELVFDSYQLSDSMTSVAGFLTQAIPFHATIDRRVNEVLDARIDLDGEWVREELKMKARDFCADIMDEVIAPAYKIANLKNGKERAYKVQLQAAKIRGTMEPALAVRRPIALAMIRPAPLRPS